MSGWRTALAYTFKSDLTQEQMFRRVNEVGSWRWVEREIDRWANFDPDNLDLFAVDLVFRSKHADAYAVFQDIRTTLFSRLLPAIGAGELTATETYE